MFKIRISAATVDGEGFFKIAKDADVINNEATLFLLKDSIGSGDRLHERMISHGLIEIDCGATGHVESSHPHGTNEDKT